MKKCKNTIWKGFGRKTEFSLNKNEVSVWGCFVSGILLLNAQHLNVKAGKKHNFKQKNLEHVFHKTKWEVYMAGKVWYFVFGSLHLTMKEWKNCFPRISKGK